MARAMNWATIERPGYFGKKRDEVFRNYDKKYGKGSWRNVWQWGDRAVEFEPACFIYTMGYYHDSFKREDLWKELGEKALDVYDHSPQDAESGLDFKIQKGNATHLQDIAIRWVFFLRGWSFKGNELIQIRSHNLYWGQNLSPGRVNFHMPGMIVAPHLEGWWNNNSIEDFWQSNKVLQILAQS